MSNQFPEVIIVSKVIHYDVNNVVEILRESSGTTPTIEEVIEKIEEWAKDDFSCGWGHEAKVKELIFTDENDNEY